MEDGRTLSDADVKAIAKELKAGLVKDFKLDVGGGVIQLVWRGIITLMFLVAIYSLAHANGYNLALDTQTH